jgi:predicted HAD superfamily hydrolase
MGKQRISHRSLMYLTADEDQTEQTQAAFAQLLAQVEVVSFDLFDTLVQRQGLFSPKDLFYLVKAEAAWQLDLPLDHFAVRRVQAEGRARVRAWGRGCEEVTLDEIYQELGRMLGLDERSVQSLQAIELACERAVLTPLASGQRRYQAACAAGKRIILISDTYFSENFVTDLVHRLGYGGVERIYLSSTWGKTKREGSLYDVVLQDLACAPRQLLHLGDNQHSDITLALGRGSRTLHTPTAKQQLRRRYGLQDEPSGNADFSALLCEVSHWAEQQPKPSTGQDVVAQMAVEQVGLLYAAFAAWLVERLKQGGYQQVYFAAREGLIMKRFFDLLAGAEGFAIESRYLYLSRAALYPSLVFTDPETARTLFCQVWDHLTLAEMLRRIDLAYEDHSGLLATYGLTNPAQRLDQTKLADFSAFLTQIWPLLEQKNGEKYRLIGTYLRQEALFTGAKAAFVDIGWHGSLQNCLLKILRHEEIDKELNGYYLGTFQSPAGASPGFQATGFLTDNQQPAAIAELIRFGPSLLELLHSAGHGSVLGYRQEQIGVVPQLEDNPVEREQFAQLIEPMQELAFAFVADHLARRPSAKLAAPDPDLLARLALRLVYAPTDAQAALLGRLRIASDFGGRMKSITGVLEWDIQKLHGDLLPDGTVPIWRPGFHMLRRRGVDS